MTCGVPHTCEHPAVFDVTLGETLLSFSTILKTVFTFFKGVGKYDKSVEILKMLAAPPMGGKI